MESGPKNHNKNNILGPNSIMVVYMEPLGKFMKLLRARCAVSVLVSYSSAVTAPTPGELLFKVSLGRQGLL